ncbi:MarR family winged helix-turn-helix transcriptional regulator [Aeromicrobium stalagmiti]|uniref:MarR family winged helix-turn-helix transcriptional regulator n=1 Tax=Aeromicrobium stalagmiti TaxID=2738988 RepID=UPI00156A47BC|nr:MarR family winged helix-turn-helix transcriptional regulator [Aeromicrobium stalagmiti]NRQ49041.1 winged helix-turn-helix transcriptional regulator [Aeromicrobium stalagmiti]
MTETTAQPAQAAAGDFGQALSALLRRYLEGARDVVDDVPGGPRGFQVLSVSSEGACSNQATIAQRLGIDRTVMTYLVDDLERAGLVERRPDPADRRARQVVLTSRGETVLAQSQERLGEVERAVLGGLPEDDAETFRTLLGRAVVDAPADHGTCDGADLPTC